MPQGCDVTRFEIPMASLYLLIPVALVFCALVIRLLLWAIDSGQYDDLDRESWRILNDSDTNSAGAYPTQRHLVANSDDSSTDRKQQIRIEVGK